MHPKALGKIGTKQLINCNHQFQYMWHVIVLNAQEDSIPNKVHLAFIRFGWVIHLPGRIYPRRKARNKFLFKHMYHLLSKLILRHACLESNVSYALRVVPR